MNGREAYLSISVIMKQILERKENLKNLESILSINTLEKIYLLKCIENDFLKMTCGRNSVPGFEIIENFKSISLTIGVCEEVLDHDRAIVTTNVGTEFYSEICSFVEKKNLQPGSNVLLHPKTFCIVGIVDEMNDFNSHSVRLEGIPNESFQDIGGMKEQMIEIKEAIETPLNHPELFQRIGIKPPKGVILYGEPGTGKTLLAKAVANQTKANFLRVAGSELVQKYLGEGPRLVREIFQEAVLNSPSIVFLDEIDAIGTTRFDSTSGGEREIQRTMLELLNQLDGFDLRDNVKVIMATNRIDSLDPALIRPGRIDRKIEFPIPDESSLKKIFEVHLKKMRTAIEITFEDLGLQKQGFTGADIKAVCTEAALFAVRENRISVFKSDLIKAAKISLERKKIKSNSVLLV